MYKTTFIDKSIWRNMNFALTRYSLFCCSLTISHVVIFDKCQKLFSFSGQAAFGHRGTMAATRIDFPEKLVADIQLLETYFVGQTTHGLLGAQPEKTEHHQALVQEPADPVFQLLVEIDQDIAAQDDVEFVEGTIRDQVVLGKQNVLSGREQKGTAASSKGDR